MALAVSKLRASEALPGLAKPANEAPDELVRLVVKRRR
jgi:hypothetical protein